jgi:protein gp37
MEQLDCESGPRSRPLDPSWVQPIRRQRAARGVPFSFKQWGGTRKKRAGHTEPLDPERL